MATLHYASGGSATEIASAGFNLVDVQSVEQLNALPDGMKGLVWLNEGDGVTSSFINKVTPFIDNPKLFGFFLLDEPDPTGRWGTYATAADLKAESDYIHSNVPGAKTFITMMNMGSSANPDYSNTYNPANTGIDLYGVTSYPVRTGTASVDYSQIGKAVAAAEAAGIPVSKMVPTYQTFGGGAWMTDTDGKYVMPTAAQLDTMLDHWAAAVPSPAFDYAYAWGSQQGDVALESSSELQAVARAHNLQSGPPATPPVSEPETPPVSEPETPPVSEPETPPSDGSAQTVEGNAGANVIKGGAGADTMIGHGGNDDYYVDNAGDKMVESSGQGQDRVWTSVSYALSAGSSIEVLGTTNDDGTTAINLTGNELAQTIHGNAGANVIKGGGGADELRGFGGNDAFVFNTALGAGNIDKVLDFNRLQDKIHLDDAVFAGLKLGGLSSDSFFAGKAAHDSSDHIIYNSSTGSLSFDSDGIGGAAQTQFATLSPGLSLTAGAFFVT
ncbi:MAG: calcium-binding protein [Mesorhizobium sp.]|nr:MAG: calcium-binding protein [Mesorhizobium sp.]